MKSVKIISFIMAILMFGLVGVSCSKTKTATVSIKFCSVGEDKKEIVYLGPVNITVNGSKKDQPTALDAATQVLQKYEKTYDLTADGNSIANVFDLKQVDSHDATKGYYSYWKCTINDKESSEGRQSQTKIFKDDVIVFEYVSGEKEREDVVSGAVTTEEVVTEAATTKPQTQVTGDNGVVID